MADENVIFNAEVKTGASGESVKSLKAEMRSLINEMGRMKEGSAEFVNAAKRAGELQDKIEDVKQTVKAFNPEQKFQAFAGVLGGVANGFAVVQGTMTAFGSENKNVEEAIKKTQGAIAIATGLNGLLGMKDAFMILGNVIKVQVVGAFQTLGRTIATLGIISLVATLATLVYQWYQEKTANEEATDALQKYNDEVKRVNELQHKAAVERQSDRDKERIAIDDAYAAEVKALQEKFDKQEITQSEFQNSAAALYDLHEAKMLGLKKKWEDADTKTEKEKQDKLKKIREDAQKAEIDAANKLADWKFQNYLEEKKAGEDQTKSIIDNMSAEITAGWDRAKQNEEIAKKEQDARIATYTAIGQGLQSLSQIAGASAEDNKALAVASAVIDTYAGATKAFAQGGVLGFVSAAAIILAGLANVQKIISTPIPKVSGGGGGIAGGTTPSLSPPPLPSAAGLTRLTGGNEPILTRDLNMKNNKVYVVETDITEKQRKVKGISDKATIK